MGVKARRDQNLKELAKSSSEDEASKRFEKTNKAYQDKQDKIDPSYARDLGIGLAIMLLPMALGFVWLGVQDSLIAAVPQLAALPPAFSVILFFTGLVTGLTCITARTVYNLVLGKRAARKTSWIQPKGDASPYTPYPQQGSPSGEKAFSPSPDSERSCWSCRFLPSFSPSQKKPQVPRSQTPSPPTHFDSLVGFF